MSICEYCGEDHDRELLESEEATSIERAIEMTMYELGISETEARIMLREAISSGALWGAKSFPGGEVVPLEPDDIILMN